MKIYIDIGNSNIKIYENEQTLTIIQNTKDNKVINNLKQFLIIENYFIISSVDKISSDIFKAYFKDNKIKYYFFTSKDYNNFFANFNVNLNELGPDRALNIIALQKDNPKNIILDFGTALTIDVVDENKYETGYIYPGMEAIKKSIVNDATALENFEFQNLTNGPLLNTTVQINDAIILSYFGTIQILINNLKTLINIDQYEIILTGGTFNKFIELLGERKFTSLFNIKYKKIDNLNYLGLKEIEKKLKL